MHMPEDRGEFPGGRPIEREERVAFDEVRFGPTSVKPSSS